MIHHIHPKTKNVKQTAEHRQGVAAVFIIILLVPLVIIMGFIVNLSYMQSMRTEQKVAVDCAAKAAVEALVRTEDVREAQLAAKRIAAQHKVGSKSFNISDDAVIFGRSSENRNGGFDFTSWARPFNAVRISGGVGTGGSDKTAAVPLMFPGLGNDVFANLEESTASFMINEVVLCLDRSGSMKFDMSGRTWSYARGNPYNYRYWDFWSNYYAPPHPTASRWAVTMDAINAFMNEASETTQPPRVGLVTWSSSINSAGTAKIDYGMPSRSIKWSSNRHHIEQSLSTIARQRNTSGVFGGTEMALGMHKGIDALKSNNAHDFANRVLIVLTDGQYQGADPFTVVSRAKQEGVTIHCISLLAGSTYSKARQIAEATGGGAYMATNSSQLRQAFQEIARSLDIVLTE